MPLERPQACACATLATRALVAVVFGERGVTSFAPRPYNDRDPDKDQGEDCRNDLLVGHGAHV